MRIYCYRYDTKVLGHAVLEILVQSDSELEAEIAAWEHTQRTLTVCDRRHLTKSYSYPIKEKGTMVLMTKQITNYAKP
jgi:hypothetical protein